MAATASSSAAAPPLQQVVQVQRAVESTTTQEDDEDSKHHLPSFSGAVVDVDTNTNTSGSSKAPRLPRWTRQEILVLIQGKKVAENRVRRGRAAGLGGGCGSSSGVEPKWATVSSYCKRHGVNRGAVQCRKRWSNLAGDFKKIKEWESQVKDDSDSFWVMRNDLRRERRLPGFFDREVYDILDGNLLPPAISTSTAVDDDHDNDEEDDDVTTGAAQHQQQLNIITATTRYIQQPIPTTTTTSAAAAAAGGVLFDSCRSAAADDALFSDFDANNNNNNNPIPIPIAIPAPTPISEKQYEPTQIATGPPPPPHPALKQAASNPEIIGSASQRERKRRRVLVEDEAAEGLDHQLQDEIVRVLDKNGKLISAQLEAHNLNLRLDREQRKDHSTSLVAVLNKLTDALATIADKL